MLGYVDSVKGSEPVSASRTDDRIVLFRDWQASGLKGNLAGKAVSGYSTKYCLILVHSGHPDSRLG